MEVRPFDPVDFTLTRVFTMQVEPVDLKVHCQHSYKLLVSIINSVPNNGGRTLRGKQRTNTWERFYHVKSP